MIAFYDRYWLIGSLLGSFEPVYPSVEEGPRVALRNDDLSKPPGVGQGNGRNFETTEMCFGNWLDSFN